MQAGWPRWRLLQVCPRPPFAKLHTCVSATPCSFPAPFRESVCFLCECVCVCASLPFGTRAIPWGPTTDDVDRTVSKRVQAPPTIFSQDPNDPGFWMDIVNEIPTNGAEWIDLQRNPERNTGFNGSLIWEAIYQENCFSRGG